MSKFTTTITDDDGTSYEVVVTYEWTKPLHATYSDPEEGGCEIINITCPVRLTKWQVEFVTEKCNRHAWELFGTCS